MTENWYSEDPDRTRPSGAASGHDGIEAVAREYPEMDSRVISAQIDEYRTRIVRANVMHGVLPFVLATLCFSVLFAPFGDGLALVVWGGAVLSLAGLRTWMMSRLGTVGAAANRRRMRVNVLLLCGLGCLYGMTPWLLHSQGQVWLLAVSNLWLAGLTVAILLSQGLMWIAGLAFAIPAMAPLLCLLLFSGDPTLSLMGIGNLLLFGYLCAIVRRTRTAMLDEVRHRVLFEQLASHYKEQRQRSDELVDELTEEVDRRKQAEIALRHARDAAERMSNQDHLTKLANRRVFDRVLAREWSRHHRAGRPLSLLLCDLDHFRSYNDHYGNCAGDQALIRVVGVIADAVRRGGDFAARYSGDQFTVLLPDTTELAALDIAEAIRQAIHDLTILHPGASLGRVLTASFGVATQVPSANHGGPEFVELADRALTRAKRGGGNCVFAIYGDRARDER